MGQCNDAYGAIQVATALARAFNCGINDLPLALVISWFEQKAAAVLLALGVPLTLPGSAYTKEKPLLGLRAVRFNRLSLRIDGRFQRAWLDAP